MLCSATNGFTWLFSQFQTSGIKITNTQVGLSAISINSITAKTYNFLFPVFEHDTDSLNDLPFISSRLGYEINHSSALSPDFFPAINCLNDSVIWLNESGLCNLGVAVKNLLLSNKVQTVKYNKLV